MEYMDGIYCSITQIYPLMHVSICAILNTELFSITQIANVKIHDSIWYICIVVEVITETLYEMLRHFLQ